MVLANISVHDIRRATVFWLFSCILQCFLHSWASKISVIFLQFSWNMQVLAHFCGRFFSIAKDSHPDWTVSFKTLAVFWNKLVPVFSHPHCQTSYWTKILQRIRNAWQVTGRRSYNVSGTPDKLLDEDLRTYQERLTSYWTKILQRSRNAWQVTGRRSYNVSGTPDKLLDEDVSGTPDKLLDEGLTTYQERLTSYWTKILQRSSNAWQVTGRRSYNVSGTPDKLLDEDLTT